MSMFRLAAKSCMVSVIVCSSLTFLPIALTYQFYNWSCLQLIPARPPEVRICVIFRTFFSLSFSNRSISDKRYHWHYYLKPSECTESVLDAQRRLYAWGFIVLFLSPM
jgi:hypothetical protein